MSGQFAEMVRAAVDRFTQKVTSMNAKTLALDQYTRDRRRLNTRLGLLMVVLIPLPVILLHARFGPLQMLATIVVLAVGVGIVYPVWWRSRHHPYREDGREKSTRLVAVTCRTVAFISLVGFMVSWAVAGTFSSWIALAFLVAGAAAFIVGFEVEERWKRILGRRAAQMGGDWYGRTGPASAEAGPAKGHSLEGSVLRFGPQLGHWRVWIAFFRAVELRDSPEMNFGDTNLVIAVLLLFLFLGNELAIAEFAFHGQVRTFPESCRKRREIAPSDELVPFRSPDVAVAVLVFPRRRRCQGQHREFTLRLRGVHLRVFSYEPN
jgi:hypothetical protein